MTAKITVSLSPELDSALTQAAVDTGVSKSRLVETYLREHPLVIEWIHKVRAEPDVTLYAASSRSPRKSKSR